MNMDGRDEDQGGDQANAEDWESTMDANEQAAEDKAGQDEFELDLEVDDIETRLPYGSEDIADK